MRIAIFVTEFPKVTETFTLREAMELRKLGNEVRIFHLTPFRNDEVIHAFAEPLVDDAYSRPWLFGGGVLESLVKTLVFRPRVAFTILGTLVKSFWSSPRLLAKSLAVVPKSLRFAEELQRWKADHVYASFAGHPATSAWIVKQAGGPPYSITCHAHDIFRSQLMLARKFSEASFVRTISEFNARFLKERLGMEPCRNLQVLHCGVDLAGNRRTNPAQDRFRVLFVGSLQYRKGVQVLLAALDRIRETPNWTCRIVGEGPMAGELKQMAQALDLAGRVEFVGALPAEKVARELHEADALVTPSIPGPDGRAEGIPTVLMEALAASLPVIASDQTGIPELVRHGETGLLFTPGDDMALSEGLERLMADRAEASRMAENGRALVDEEFNLTRNVERLNRLMAHEDPSPELLLQKEVTA